MDLASLQASLGELQESFSLLREQADAQCELLKKQNAEAHRSVKDLSLRLEAMEELRMREAEAASRDAELMSLQLQQLQDELRHYFLLSRRQAEMLVMSEEICTKAVLLTAELLQ